MKEIAAKQFCKLSCPPLVHTQFRFISQCTKIVMLFLHTIMILEHYPKEFLMYIPWQETEILNQAFSMKKVIKVITDEQVPGIEPSSPAWEAAESLEIILLILKI